MRYLSVAFIACILLCSGCSRSMHKNEFSRIDSLIQKEDTTALLVLDSLGKEKENFSTSDKMYYNLLLADAHNKFFISLASDTFMCDVVNYFLSHGSDEEQMKSLYLLGCVYRDKGDVPLAIEKYNQAVGKADTTSLNCNYTLLCRIYAQMAYLFNEQRSPLMELKMWNKAIPYAWKVKDTLAALNYYEHTAYAYDILGNKEKQREINNTAYQQYIACGHPECAAGSLTIFIDEEVKEGKFRQAKKHIDEYINYSGAFGKNGEIAEGRELFYYYVGKYYEAISKLDSAQIYYRKVLCYPNDLLNLESGYHGLMSVFSKKHQPDSVVKYARLYADANDSVNLKKSAEEITRVQALYNYSENKKIAIEKTKENKQLVFFIHSALFILIIAGIIVFYEVRKRIAQRKREQNKENEKYTSLLFRYKEITEELNFMQSNVEDYMKKKEESIKQLKTQLSQFQESPICLDDTQQEQSMLSFHIVKLLHDKARHAEAANEKDWIKVNDVVSSNLSDFYVKISQSELTKQELRTCILIRLSFIPSEIATLLNTTKQRISNIRISINKKLFHQSGTSGLDEQIHAI